MVEARDMYVGVPLSNFANIWNFSQLKREKSPFSLEVYARDNYCFFLPVILKAKEARNRIPTHIHLY